MNTVPRTFMFIDFYILDRSSYLSCGKDTSKICPYKNICPLPSIIAQSLVFVVANHSFCIENISYVILLYGLIHCRSRSILNACNNNSAVCNGSFVDTKRKVNSIQ